MSRNWATEKCPGCNGTGEQDLLAYPIKRVTCCECFGDKTVPYDRAQELRKRFKEEEEHIEQFRKKYCGGQ